MFSTNPKKEFLFLKLHFFLSSANAVKLDQSKNLSYGKGLNFNGIRQKQSRYAFNTLLNDKILDWSKFKAFADEKINVTQTLKFALGRV